LGINLRVGSPYIKVKFWDLHTWGLTGVGWEKFWAQIKPGGKKN